jgi:hypothetical protein
MLRDLLLRSLAVCLAGCVLLTSSRASGAGGEDPESLIKQGVELRRQGKDALAVGYLRRAHQLAATPRTAAQLGLVELAVKDYLDAERFLSEALLAGDPWINEHRQTLEDSRARARKNLLRVELAGAPAGTTAALEGVEATRLSTDGVLWLAPGTAVTIHLEAPGHEPTDVRAQGAAGENRRFALDMPALDATKSTTPPPAQVVTPSPPPAVLVQTEPPPPSTPAEETAPGRSMRIAGISAGAVGVAAAVVGVVLVAQGSSKRSALEAELNSNGKTPYDPSNSNWKSLRNAGIGCLVGGGVAIGAGVALYLFGAKAAHDQDAKPSAPPEPSVSFISGPGFGFMSYQRSF